MGIQGLLKALAPLLLGEENGSKPCFNIRQFANQSLAIDASSWLFKASYSCAERLVEQSLELQDQPIDRICERIICRYFVARCEELLRNASIRSLYIVFDGMRCPLKEITNKEREERRRKNLDEARRFKAFGRNEEASEKYKACIKIASWMSSAVARAIEDKWGNSYGDQSRQVHVVFSPMEADAQLAKLCVDGICDAVVTEDSDILLYSAVTQTPFPIIYKLDRNNGDCDVITMDWLLTHHSNRTITMNNKNTTLLLHNTELFSSYRRYLDITVHKTSDKSNKGKKPKSYFSSALIDMILREGKHPGWGVRMFVQAAILTGCDYAPSRLNGVGIVNAFRMVKDFANRDANHRFSLLLRSLPSSTITCDDKTRPVDAVTLYEDILSKSEAAFYFHRVLDIRSGKAVALCELNSANHHDTSVVPCLKRFKDLLFLGRELKSTDGNTLLVTPSILERRGSASSHGSTKTIKHRVLHPIIDLYAAEEPTRTRTLPCQRNIPSSNPFALFTSSSSGSDGSCSVVPDDIILDEHKSNLRIQVRKTVVDVDTSSSDTDPRSTDRATVTNQNKRVLSRVLSTIDRIEQSVKRNKMIPLAESTNKTVSKGRKETKKTSVCKKAHRSSSITSFFKPLPTSH